MSRIAIDYDKLLELAEVCRLTRHGSQWIDAQRLIEEISKSTFSVRVSTPNNVEEIIANGEKSLQQGKRFAPTLGDLAAMLGVTRQTLDKWRGAKGITLKKELHPTGQRIGRMMLKKPQYDLKAVVNDLKKVYKIELSKQY